MRILPCLRAYSDNGSTVLLQSTGEGPIPSMSTRGTSLDAKICSVRCIRSAAEPPNSLKRYGSVPALETGGEGSTPSRLTRVKCYGSMRDPESCGGSSTLPTLTRFLRSLSGGLQKVNDRGVC